MSHKKITQAVVSTLTKIIPHQTIEEFALFTPAGVAIDLNPQTTANITAAPIVVAGAIGTAAKTTTAAIPMVNTKVLLKFTSGNSAASPTVTFATGGAIPVLLGGSAPSSSETVLAANGIAEFFYDGTNLHQIGVYS